MQKLHDSLSSKSPEKVKCIIYNGAITQVTGSKIIDAFTKVINKKSIEIIYFLLSSEGGDTNAGISLYHFLKGIPIKIIIHNTGAIDSIANIVFLAGEERYACDFSSFLLHGTGFNFSNFTGAMNTIFLQEKLSILMQEEKKISKILLDNTKLTENEIKDFFINGRSVDPHYAKSKEIIHEIQNMILAPGMETINVLC